jgi:hypothetical protein
VFTLREQDRNFCSNNAAVAKKRVLSEFFLDRCWERKSTRSKIMQHALHDVVG